MFHPRLLLLTFALAACGDEAAPEPATPAKAPAAAKTAPAKTAKSTKVGGGKTAAKAAKEKAAGPEPTALPADANPALSDPSKATETAPDTYRVKFATSEGDFVVQVTRAWAPNGADRFYNLCKIGYFHDAAFFRNIPGFMVQWGMSPYPEATKVWQKATITDDPVVESNQPLYVTFAKTGAPNSRSTQIFINHGDNKNLDGMGFAPFGKVVEGADVVGKLYGGYGEGAPRGRGPSQGIIGKYGKAYLDAEFPKLSTIKSTTIQ